MGDTGRVRRVFVRDWRCALVMILAVVLFSGCTSGVAEGKLDLFHTADSAENETFTLLTESFTDRLIVDQESALAAIGDAADMLGIGDVNKELTDCRENIAFGNTYYRFAQEYEGIPVYGRSVVVIADEKGTALSLTGNTAQISKTVSLIPSVREETVKSEICAYAAKWAERADESCEICPFDAANLVIYQKKDASSVLAYDLLVLFNEEPYRFVVDAHNAFVYEAYPLSLTDAVSLKYQIEGREQTVDLWMENGEYRLYDQGRNLILYTANGETLIRTLVFSNNKGEKWTYSTKDEKWRDAAGTVVSEPEGSHLYVESCFFETEEREYGVFPVTSPTIDFDTSAVQMMIWLEETSDFYREKLERNGWSGTNENELYVVYNCKNGSYSSTCGDFSVLSLNTQTQIDVVAHEFMHSVEQSESGMCYQGESGAIMEALSDIFGEIVEDWYDDNALNDSCDWYHNSGLRDLIAPEKSTEASTPHPSVYYGDYWYDTDGDLDNGGVHLNSTVISHAAYLMWRGIDGSPAFERLNTNELAQLFYSAMFSLPSDCSFSEFRTIVQNTADIMCKQGWLTEKQCQCVSNAFFQVGITPAAATYSLAENAKLMIYDINREPYHNCTVNITGLGMSILQSPGRLVQRGETISYAVDAEGLLELSLKTGIYQIEIIDNADEENRHEFTIAVTHAGKDALSVYTDFGAYRSDAYDRYLAAARETIATGSWTEDMSMTVDITFTSGLSATKEMVVAGSTMDIDGYEQNDRSGLRISGSANMTDAEQDYAWNMEYANGMAHYDHLEPTAATEDAETTPDIFNFFCITQDMISAESSLGNIIKFTVRGDAMAKAGLPPVDMMKGIENLQYGDVHVILEIDTHTSKIATLSMSFHASMTYRGSDSEADYVIEYRFLERSSELDDIPLRSINELSELLNDFFKCYQWGDDDIISGAVFDGRFVNEREVCFDLRVQTKNGELTHQANMLVGTVTVDAAILKGYIEWSGGTQDPIDLLAYDNNASVNENGSNQMKVLFDRFEASGQEYAVISGVNTQGSTVWTYTSEKYGCGDLHRISSIGVWENQYYFLEDRAVIALDRKTGAILWKNNDFGGGLLNEQSAMIDSDGSVYLCGYYGPDFYAIDADGNSLCKIESFSEGYTWAYKIRKEEDRIAVTLANGPEGYCDIGSEGYIFYIKDFKVQEISEAGNTVAATQETYIGVWASEESAAADPSASYHTYYLGVFDGDIAVRCGYQWLEIGTWSLNQYGEIEFVFPECYYTNTGEGWDALTMTDTATYAYDPGSGELKLIVPSVDGLVNINVFYDADWYEAYDAFRIFLSAYWEVGAKTWLTQQDLNLGSGKAAKLWKGLENEIYAHLSEILSGDALRQLAKSEESWIAEQASMVEQSCKEYEGGSICALIANSTEVHTTSERVDYLMTLLPDGPA